MAISADIFLYHASNFISKVGRFIFGVAKAALTEGPAELLCELDERAKSYGNTGYGAIERFLASVL